jgi:hypothetical protein
MSEELVRITIYATPKLKAQLEKAAKETKPKTTISALGSMFIEEGLERFAAETKPDPLSAIRKHMEIGNDQA